MAKIDPITTFTGKATASAQTYGASLTIPFDANRIAIGVISSTGSGSLILSFDGINDAMTLHNTSGMDNFTYEQQRVDKVYYRVDAASTTYTFVVNAEAPAYPNIF